MSSTDIRTLYAICGTAIRDSQYLHTHAIRDVRYWHTRSPVLTYACDTRRPVLTYTMPHATYAWNTRCPIQTSAVTSEYAMSVTDLCFPVPELLQKEGYPNTYTFTKVVLVCLEMKSRDLTRY
eukprot:210063-Rhodomonas_salina.1